MTVPQWQRPPYLSLAVVWHGNGEHEKVRCLWTHSLDPEDVVREAMWSTPGHRLGATTAISLCETITPLTDGRTLHITYGQNLNRLPGQHEVADKSPWWWNYRWRSRRWRR